MLCSLAKVATILIEINKKHLLQCGIKNLQY